MLALKLIPSSYALRFLCKDAKEAALDLELVFATLTLSISVLGFFSVTRSLLLLRLMRTSCLMSKDINVVNRQHGIILTKNACE